MVFCGSHDHHLYCWKVDDGGFKQVWRTLLDSEVYAVPSVGQIKTIQHFSTDKAVESLILVCACSTNGQVYIMDAAKGDVLGQLELPWDVFSSPVLLPSGRIVVGCRDDNVYCLAIDFIQF